MSENEEINPIPGQLYDWMIHETQLLGEEANKGQMYQSKLDSFVEAAEVFFREVIDDQNADPEHVLDAQHASNILAMRLEWIERSKRGYEVWEAEASQFVRESNVFLERKTEVFNKYVLFAYGAAFLFAFNGLISNQTPVAHYEAFKIAIYILIVGLFITIGYFWLLAQVQSKDRIFLADKVKAWDRTEVKEPRILKIRFFINPLLFAAIVAMPIAALVFISEIERVENTPLFLPLTLPSPIQK